MTIDVKQVRCRRFGWYMYDWANSAFYTTVITVFLGPYLTSVARAAAIDGVINPLGFSMNPGAWFPYMVSISVILQVLILPYVGALADRTGMKRRILAVSAFAGALCTTALYFITLEAGNYILGGALFICANVAFGASIVVYNAFLPDLAAPEERDKVSARGWAVGYLGSGLLLLVNLIMYSRYGSTDGNSSDLIVRIILASAGIWWAAFTLVPLLTLPRGRPPAPSHANVSSWQQFKTTLGSLKAYPGALLFLIAFLIYNDAVQTVITMSSVFGQEELGLGLDTLTQVILMVQFVAIPGALFFERLAAWTSTRTSLIVSLVIWTIAVFLAWGYVHGETSFFLLAVGIALVLGGTQALSRSFFSVLIPDSRSAEYFSLYEISDKGTSWIGPLMFGVIYDFTGSYRTAILSLAVFFVIGLTLLFFVPQKSNTGS